MTPGIDIQKLRITCWPDPVLRKACTSVESFGAELAALTQRMLVLMREGRGVGLAAPQVGLPFRLFVCNPTGEPGDDFAVINPELSDGEGRVEGEEGCLSIPQVSVVVPRAQRIRIRGFDAEGRPVERVASDLEARIWQHETDHLDGRLILDYMSDGEEIANRRYLKQLKADWEKQKRKSA